MFSSVLERRYTEFFLEKILKMRLAGEKQKITDCRKGTIGISQKEFCFLQFCFHNISAYCFSRLFFELLHKRGTALFYIEGSKKVSFRYFSLNYKGEKVFRREGRRYIVNPVVLVCDNDNYYLVCYDDKHEGTANYRLDRMDELAEEDTPITEREKSRDFNQHIYRRQSFSIQKPCQKDNGGKGKGNRDRIRVRNYNQRNRRIKKDRLRK